MFVIQMSCLILYEPNSQEEHIVVKLCNDCNDVCQVMRKDCVLKSTRLLSVEGFTFRCNDCNKTQYHQIMKHLLGKQKCDVFSNRKTKSCFYMPDTIQLIYITTNAYSTLVHVDTVNTHTVHTHAIHQYIYIQYICTYTYNTIKYCTYTYNIHKDRDDTERFFICV